MTEMVPIQRQIWEAKYRLTGPDGTPIDNTIEDTWRRVARALAAPERDPARWEGEFYGALEGFRFLPGGRIIAGAGAQREVTLFNCFVMGAIPDSLSGIFTHLREAALTMQQGGGIGYDFSTLRPQGSPVVGVGADASGPLSFMDVWDAMCRTIMSAGTRRGAMMATLRCDHPDIEAFVDAKRDPARLRMFNLSVLATDAFMQAIADDEDWPLRWNGEIKRVVEARGLWDRIMRATYDVAEPGVIFIDRINRENNLAYCETITATNPCGEVPLPPYGACLLGSLNLAAGVTNPFSAQADLDMSALRHLIWCAVRMLDNVIEVSRFPLATQRDEAFAKRRIGLGVTGLADALTMCGLRYGSAEAQACTGRWLSFIEHEAYLASADLAREKGCFPLMDPDRFLAGERARQLPAQVRKAISLHGLRNSHLTAIAPTGTISLLAGNVSGGIEPPFALHYDRDVLQADGSRRPEAVEDYAYRVFRRMHGPDAALPACFADAQNLRAEDHLITLAEAAAHIDQSISKTINLPADIPFDAFMGIYRRAYDLGCKSCTTYRPNAVTGSVLRVRAAEPAEGEAAAGEPPAAEAAVVNLTAPLSRPRVLAGATYKIAWPGSEHALYVTMTDLDADGRRRPFEIFINTKNMEHYAWIVGLTRMISAVFRRGGDVAFVAEEMKAIFDPRGGAWVGGRYVPSILAAIGDVITEHLVAIGFLAGGDEIELPAVAAAEGGKDALGALMTAAEYRREIGYRQCPSCGGAALVRSENCDRCLECGYTKC